MRIATFVLLFLLSSLATAANIRSSFVATNGTVVVNSTAFTGGQEALFIDWLWAMYAPKDTVEGSPTFGQVLPRTTANEAQAYRNYAIAIHAGTYAQVRRWKREQDQAAIQEPSTPAE
jgi:hypothetical protein